MVWRWSENSKVSWFARNREFTGLAPYPRFIACCQIQHFIYNQTVMNLSNLTAAQLKHAADIIEKIEKLNAEVTAILGSSPATVVSPTAAVTPGKRGPKKGGMSAAGRARIAAAQKARWAKVRAEKKA